MIDWLITIVKWVIVAVAAILLINAVAGLIL